MKDYKATIGGIGIALLILLKIAFLMVTPIGWVFMLFVSSLFHLGTNIVIDLIKFSVFTVWPILLFLAIPVYFVVKIFDF